MMMRCVKPGRPVLLLCVIGTGLMICGCARTPQEKYAEFFETGTAQLKKHDYACWLST
jgi:hypothetical protein